MNVDGVGPSAGKAAAPQARDRVSPGFEAFLLHALLKSMRAALPRSGFLGYGRGGELFTGLLDARWAEEAARQEPFLRAMMVDRYAAAGGASRGANLDLRAGSSL